MIRAALEKAEKEPKGEYAAKGAQEEQADSVLADVKKRYWQELQKARSRL